MYVPTSRGSPKSPGQRLQGASQICLMSWLTRGLGQVPHVTRKLQSLGLRRKILESARAIGLYFRTREKERFVGQGEELKDAGEPCIEDAGTQLVSLELAGMTDRQVIPEPGPLAGGPFVVICRGRHSRACV